MASGLTKPRPGSPPSALGISHHHGLSAGLTGPHGPHAGLTGPSSSMAAMAAAAAAQAMRDYPGLTHYEEDLSDEEEIDCDS